MVSGYSNRVYTLKKQRQIIGSLLWSGVAQVAVGSLSLVVRAPAAKASSPGINPQQLPCFFFFLSFFLLGRLVTNVEGMKDLW